MTARLLQSINHHLRWNKKIN
uniref:Uncharacterized protein n=1 Tax=Anguilla anguilla TaxID=7936 RepID=A0A0E9SDB8_ANGAN